MIWFLASGGSAVRVLDYRSDPAVVTVGSLSKSLISTVRCVNLPHLPLRDKYLDFEITKANQKYHRLNI